jgi:hypothetical protein
MRFPPGRTDPSFTASTLSISTRAARNACSGVMPDRIFPLMAASRYAGSRSSISRSAPRLPKSARNPPAMFLFLGFLFLGLTSAFSRGLILVLSSSFHDPEKRGGSFITQGHHWIDSSSSSCGNIRRCQCCTCKNRHRSQRATGIGWGQVEQHASH